MKTIFLSRSQQPVARARDPPRRDIRSANNRVPVKKAPDNKQKQHDNKPVNNGVCILKISYNKKLYAHLSRRKNINQHRQKKI